MKTWMLFSWERSLLVFLSRNPDVPPCSSTLMLTSHHRRGFGSVLTRNCSGGATKRGTKQPPLCLCHLVLWGCSWGVCAEGSRAGSHQLSSCFSFPSEFQAGQSPIHFTAIPTLHPAASRQEKGELSPGTPLVSARIMGWCSLVIQAHPRGETRGESPWRQGQECLLRQLPSCKALHNAQSWDSWLENLPWQRVKGSQAELEPIIH